MKFWKILSIWDSISDDDINFCNHDWEKGAISKGEILEDAYQCKKCGDVKI